MYQCTILINQLKVQALIGVLLEELHTPQPLTVSVQATLKNKPANLTESLNYAKVVEFIEGLAINHIALVEEFAEQVCLFCLKYKVVEEVIVTVQKTSILPQTEGVGCRIMMNNSGLYDIEIDKWSDVKIKLQMQSKKPLYFNEGDVWWCSVGRNIGNEIYGKGPLFSRPVVVLKKYSFKTFLGAPLTSKQTNRPNRFAMPLDGRSGEAILDQLKTIDSKRLSTRITTLGKKRLRDLKAAVIDTI